MYAKSKYGEKKFNVATAAAAAAPVFAASPLKVRRNDYQKSSYKRAIERASDERYDKKVSRLHR